MRELEVLIRELKGEETRIIMIKGWGERENPLIARAVSERLSASE